MQVYNIPKTALMTEEEREKIIKLQICPECDGPLRRIHFDERNEFKLRARECQRCLRIYITED